MLKPEGMEAFLELLSLLAEGRPVPIDRLAARLEWPEDKVESALRPLPLEYEDSGRRIIGAGITLEPTRHRFRVDDRTLYTWCAWDAVIFPPILERTVEVESACPATGNTIRLAVTPEGVEDLDPAGAVVSLPTPGLGQACNDIGTAFCDSSNFFLSRDAALESLEGSCDADILSVEQAFELGRLLFTKRRAGGQGLPRLGRERD